MMREESDLLRGERPIDLLRGTSLEALASRGRVETLPRGALLFEQGRTAELLHVLLEGAVALSAGAEGRHATVVELVRPVDCLGLEAVLDTAAHALSARTVEPCRLLVVPAEEVRRRIAEKPALALAMMVHLAARNRRLVEQIKDLKLRSGPQRLGCWLLRLVDEHSAAGAGVRLPLPKGLLAQRLGMTPESLSRAFSTLRGHGLAMQGSRVAIVDRARLEAFCRPDAEHRG